MGKIPVNTGVKAHENMQKYIPARRAGAAALWSYRDWRAVLAAFILCGLLFGVWASRIPAFKDRFDLDAGTLGILLLTFAFGAIASFPFAGALSERVGPTRLTVVCAVGYCPALASLPLTSDVIVLAIALFVFGIFHGSMDVAMNGWAAQVEGRLKRSTMSIFHAGFSLGAGLGAASGFWAVQQGFDPGLHFGLMAGGGGILAVAIMIVGANNEPMPKRDTTYKGLIVLPSRTLFFVGLIAFAVSMGEGAMVDWSAVYLVVVVGASEATAALGFAAFSAMMFLTRLLGGLLVDRSGQVRITQLSAAIAFFGLFLVIVSGTASMAIFGFALIGVGYAIVMPLVFSLAANDPEQVAGPAIASVAMLAYGGMLLGPPTIGFLAEIIGLRMSFAVLSGLAAMAFVLAPRLRPPL